MRTNVITIENEDLAVRVFRHLQKNCRDLAGHVSSGDWVMEPNGHKYSIYVKRLLDPSNHHWFRATAEAYKQGLEDSINDILTCIKVKLL